MVLNKKIFERAALAALFLSIGFAVYGLIRSDVLRDFFWNAGLARDLGAFALIGIAQIGLWQFFSKRSAILFSLVALFIYLAAGLGFVSVIVVAYVVFALTCLGALVCGQKQGLGFNHWTWVFFCVGAAVFCAVVGPLLTFPIHFGATYVIVLSVPVVAWLMRKDVIQNPGERFVVNLEKLTEIPTLTLILVATYFCYQVRGVVVPTVAIDDISYHLSLPSQLLEHGRALFDVKNNVWAVAPWASDLIYSVPFVIAGVDCRGALNFVFCVGIIHLLYGVLDLLDFSRAGKIVGVILAISHPLLFALPAMMQTELLIAFSGLAALYAMLSMTKNRETYWVIAASVVWIAGLLLGIKTTNAFLVMPILGVLLALTIHYSHKLMFGRMALAMIGATSVAMVSYITAYYFSGNPVFPLFNKLFHSPFFFSEQNFFNPKYVGNFGISLWYKFEFYSRNFYESLDGVLGMSVFLLAPFAVIRGFVIKQAKPVSIIWLGALFCSVIVLMAQQYIRYIFPILVLVSALSGAIFVDWAIDKKKPIFIFSLAIITISIFINQLSAPGANWLLSNGMLDQFTQSGKKEFSDKYAPEVNLLRTAMQLDRTGRVLFDPDRPFGSTAAGRETYFNFPGHAVAKKLYDAETSEKVLTLLKENEIAFFIGPGESSKDNIKFPGYRLFREMLNQHGDLVTSVGTANLWRMNYASFVGNRNFLPQERFDRLTNGWSVRGKPYVSAAGLNVTADDFLFHPFDTLGIRSFMLKASVACADAGTSLIVQMNWYRKDLISSERRNFACESGLISTDYTVPSNASIGEIYFIGAKDKAVLVTDASLRAVK